MSACSTGNTQIAFYGDGGKKSNYGWAFQFDFGNDWIKTAPTTSRLLRSACINLSLVLTRCFAAEEAWATSLLLATAQVLGRRVAAMNQDLIKLSAELRRNAPEPQIRKAVAEIEQLRKRLMTEWTFR